MEKAIYKGERVTVTDRLLNGRIVIEFIDGEVKKVWPNTLSEVTGPKEYVNTDRDGNPTKKDATSPSQKKGLPSVAEQLGYLNTSEDPKAKGSTKKAVGNTSEDRRNSIVPADYLEKYTKNRCVRGGERVTVIDNGDAVAQALRGATIEEIWEEAERILGADVVAECRTRYAHLNSGQQSMNLRNRIRGHYKKIITAGNNPENRREHRDRCIIDAKA